MDTSFNIKDYRPTRPPAPEDRPRTNDQIELLFTQLRNQTTNIIKCPYDPDNWSRRAKTLSELRYPELAVGDAHKAALLCRSHMHTLDKRKHTSWRLGHRMGFWMYDPLPHDLDEDEYGEDDYHDRLEQYLGKLQCRDNKIEKRNLVYSPFSDEGQMLRRMYPWIQQQHRSRDDKLVKRLNSEFVGNSANTEYGKPFCVVKRDAFGSGDRDVLGVFAARHIRQGQVILIDETTAWGTNQPSKEGEYQTFDRRCRSGPPWPLIDGKIDLSWIRDEIPKQAGPVLLLCRLLLSAICDTTSENEHPLDHHLIARLTPTYREDGVDRFDWLNDIVIPNMALQKFGIDIFANHKYDTWVLFTIQARIMNNSCGDSAAESLNPLFALFNHSCDPNVEWSSAAKDHRTILVRTRRNIKKGEQLLVEYDQFTRDQPLNIRRQRMYKWLDAACQCPRCLAEEEILKNQPETVNLWDDVHEKIVFPEDLLKN